MEKQRKKKRSHEEVVAAREAYAAEKHQRQLEKEKKALERAKLKEEREARKNMTSLEKAADRRQKKVEKLKRVSSNENHNPLYSTYTGNVKIGDTVAARFAGCTIFGEIIKISDENSNVDGEDEEPQFEFRKGVKNIKLYTILGDDSIKYPVKREQIIAKKGE